MSEEEHGKKSNDSHSDSQAGGHSGILIFEDNRVLKKSKQGEINFLQWLHTQNTEFSESLKRISPIFYGIEERNSSHYIVMENLLAGYEHPNIMDCKLGRITWTSHHSEKTIQNQQAKNLLTTTGTLGFRISGIVVKNSAGEKTEHLVKKEAFDHINDQNIHEYFRKIVTENGNLQKDVVSHFIAETEKIRDWFAVQTVKTFKASSVLYINGKNGRAQVKYIDFAHSEDANGQIDSNVLEGLENVILIWKRLL